MFQMRKQERLRELCIVVELMTHIILDHFKIPFPYVAAKPKQLSSLHRTIYVLKCIAICMCRVYSKTGGGPPTIRML